MKLFNTYDEFISNPWIIVLFGLIAGFGYLLDSLFVDFPTSIDILHYICSAASFITLTIYLLWRKHNWNLLKILVLILFAKLVIMPYLFLDIENFGVHFLRNTLFYWATMVVVALFFGTRFHFASALVFAFQYVSILVITENVYLTDTFITIGIVFSIFVLVIYLFITQVESFLTQQEQVQNELRDQTSQLKQSNLTKGKLLSIIGHDLRSPLMSLTSLAVLIKDEAEEVNNEDLTDYVGLLSTTVDQTSFLVNNLLEWSRSQENKIQLNINPVRIEPFLYSLHDLVEFKLNQKNISFTFGPLKVAEVSADQNALHTILRNLITNAIKFTNPGGSIVVSTMPDKLGTFIVIEDNGVGMNKETLRTLQDITSYQSKKGTSEERGTGIGFNLCIELMQLHNGHINIESELKKGTKITLFFPTVSA